MPIFDQNHGLTPWEECQFSVLRTLCFYSFERRFFVLEYRKRHFPGLCCLKRKVGKMAIFGPKPWVNPFGKVSIFLTFRSSCFYSQERRFFVVEYRERHFPGLYCLKRKVGKMANFGQNHAWVIPFEKFPLFDFLNFLFLQLRKAFFRSRIS